MWVWYNNRVYMMSQHLEMARSKKNLLFLKQCWQRNEKWASFYYSRGNIHLLCTPLIFTFSFVFLSQMFSTLSIHKYFIHEIAHSPTNKSKRTPWLCFVEIQSEAISNQCFHLTIFFYSLSNDSDEPNLSSHITKFLFLFYQFFSLKKLSGENTATRN